MATDQGWAFPGTSRKAHYFRGDGRSLCRRWGSIGMPDAMFSTENVMTPSPDDCTVCRRRLDKEGTGPL